MNAPGEYPTPSAIDPYDLLADEYRDFCSGKSSYFEAVDRFILARFPAAPTRLLDVGAGDGFRAMALARAKGVDHVVLCEPSVEMAARCRGQNPTEVWNLRAEELPALAAEQHFDVITCLWNVLGHVGGRSARIEALERMKNLLRPEGVICLDVNNRHNAAAYGRWRILYRRVIDALAPDDRRGDAVFDWKIKSRVIRATGHLFSPRELEGLIAQSGLLIRERGVINYQTGEVRSSPFQGQLVYIVQRPKTV